jgi:hypothetical protein
MFTLSNLKISLAVVILFLFSSCSYIWVTKSETCHIEFDNHQFKAAGDTTYRIYIQKENGLIIYKSKTKIPDTLLDSVIKWEEHKINRTFWVIGHGSSEEILDYRKYKYEIEDTSVLTIDTIEHINFKESGLGQITFKIKKDGQTCIVAKKKSKVRFRTPIVVSKGIVSMVNKYPKATLYTKGPMPSFYWHLYIYYIWWKDLLSR